ncbi:MAG TPA: hypothetical protein VG407_14820 [Caulobacteraceae bacterium]|nr:hypothetical protein [Caulobacteraceae bacterium]
MKLLQIIGVLVVIVGAIWILQGMSLIPQGNFLAHSFMMGQRQWALYGGVAVVIGLALLLFGGRKKV